MAVENQVDRARDVLCNDDLDRFALVAAAGGEVDITMGADTGARTEWPDLVASFIVAIADTADVHPAVLGHEAVGRALGQLETADRAGVVHGGGP